MSSDNKDLKRGSIRSSFKKKKVDSPNSIVDQSSQAGQSACFSSDKTSEPLPSLVSLSSSSPLSIEILSALCISLISSPTMVMDNSCAPLNISHSSKDPSIQLRLSLYPSNKHNRSFCSIWYSKFSLLDYLIKLFAIIVVILVAELIYWIEYAKFYNSIDKFICTL